MEMIGNIIDDLQAFWPLLQTIIFVLGLSVFLVGLFKLAQAGQQGPQGQQGLKLGFAGVLAGTLMLNLWTFMDVLSQSFFMQESNKGIAYTAPDQEAPGANLIEFAVIVIRIIGLGAWARGVWMIYEAQAGNGQTGIGSAVVFIVSGMIAINFVTFAELLGNSLGGQVEQSIDQWLVN